MLIMSFPGRLASAEFGAYKNEIYSTVYGKQADVDDEHEYALCGQTDSVSKNSLKISVKSQLAKLVLRLLLFRNRNRT